MVSLECGEGLIDNVIRSNRANDLGLVRRTCVLKKAGSIGYAYALHSNEDFRLKETSC
jgi:hypothetical protein